MKALNKIFLLVALSASTAASAQEVHIKGHVQFIDSTFTVQVYRYAGSGKNILAETKVDPATHNYHVTVPVNEVGQAVVDCGRWQSVNVWLEDEDLSIDFRGLDTARIKIKNPPYVYINGGRNNELMNILNFEAYREYQAMIAYSQNVYKAKIEDNAVKSKLSSSLYDFGSQNSTAWYRWAVVHYADRNSVIVPISRLNYDDNKTLIDGALSKLEKSSTAGAKVAAKYRADQQAVREARERMKVGAPAPEFKFQTEKGKTVSLSKYKGRVLVLDFWASWCGPCRQEIPNMKKIYADMKGKKVEFLSVSIDAKKDAWLKALKEEQMPWALGWTPDAGKEVMQLYQFSGIPFIIVIDEQGRIYRKNVRGEGIRAAIEDALAGKPAAGEKQVKSVAMGGMM